jgi:hypothetical protein
MKKKRQVVGDVTVPLFKVVKGQIATVIKSFWRNGEGWYLLEINGERFESPDIFWEEKQ